MKCIGEMKYANLSLAAISPVDGRYADKTESLSDYFSEFALIKYRVRVEILYFIALCEYPLHELKDFNRALDASLKEIYENFSITDAQAIKTIEKTTNHDVKAVEYFIKEKFKKMGIEKYEEFIHFGLTSQDINNTAIPLMLKDAMAKVIIPAIQRLINALNSLAQQWKDVPMLAFTHGQPASPTKMGKELRVFSYRIEQQLEVLKNIPLSAKFGGATGNFNAHHLTYPVIDWVAFANHFVNQTLGLQRSQFTTQIDNYDHLAAQFDAHKRINTILIDLCRDLWQYISLGYFKQKIEADEIGSSAMPHKVNPIDFENAEGNLGIANALYEHLAAKLPISRLQRDLTDSTVLRNIGVPAAHGLIACKSIIKGIHKLQLNEARLKEDLENNWAVVAEAIQTVLRQQGYPAPYEALKSLTRKNQKMTASNIQNFIDTLNISENTRVILKEITPYNYTGI